MINCFTTQTQVIYLNDLRERAVPGRDAEPCLEDERRLVIEVDRHHDRNGQRKQGEDAVLHMFSGRAWRIRGVILTKAMYSYSVTL